MAGEFILSNSEAVTAMRPMETGANAIIAESGATLLVTEIHHRVMNSFQVISVLAQRCSRVRRIADLPPVLDDLSDSLMAFAAVHRQLAMPPSGCFKLYCTVLGGNLVAAFGRSDTILVGMDPVDLPQSLLAQVALIVAELLTNCLKHSLSSAPSGSIRLDLRVSYDRLVIEAQDSAASAIPQDAPPPSRVVAALSAGLGGEARIVDRQGYCAQVSLPLIGLDERGDDRPRAAQLARPPSSLSLTASAGSSASPSHAL